MVEAKRRLLVSAPTGTYQPMPGAYGPAPKKASPQTCLPFWLLIGVVVLLWGLHRLWWSGAAVDHAAHVNHRLSTQ